MKGYPRCFARKEDYENILRDFPEWAEPVKNELKTIKNLKDDKMSIPIALIDPDDPNSEWKTEEILNPHPVFKRKGFKDRKELNDLITGTGGTKNDL